MGARPCSDLLQSSPAAASANQCSPKRSTRWGAGQRASVAKRAGTGEEYKNGSTSESKEGGAAGRKGTAADSRR